MMQQPLPIPQTCPQCGGGAIVTTGRGLTVCTTCGYGRQLLVRAATRRRRRFHPRRKTPAKIS